MLACEDISVSMGGNIIFSKVSFTLLAKNCLIIKGSNGSGKSTLLKTIAGFVKPAKGQILWDEKNIHDDLSLFQSSQIAFLGHNLGLKKFFTIYQNLDYFADCKQTKGIILACLKQFGIEQYADWPLYKLSQGTIKKVALARVMLSNSRLWILDEPDNNLDDFGKEMLAKLLEIRISEGGSVVMTSHEGNINPKFPQINIEDYRK